MKRVRRNRAPDLLAGFWFITSLVAASGLVLAGISLTLDKLAGNAGIIPALVISPDSARTILGSIAGSLITIASLTSSLTIVTLQLLSSQYTPRAIRGFLSTRLSQIVLGTFIGVFLYCLIVLVAVREPGDENDPFVPSLSIIVSVVLAVLALVMLVLFIHAMSQTIQVSTMTARIANDTSHAIHRVHDPALPGAGEPQGQPVSLVLGTRSGYVREVSPEAIAAALTEVTDTAGLHVDVCVRAGDFVTVRSRVAQVWASPSDAMQRRVERAVRQAVIVERERDLRGDPAYGVRQLVDIALRALSPGINDPSTAVTCIGYLRGLLEDLAGRPMPERRALVRGRVTVTTSLVGFADYLAHISEIATYAIGDARVVAALLEALDSVARCSADDRRARLVAGLRDQIRAEAVRLAKLDFDRSRLDNIG